MLALNLDEIQDKASNRKQKADSGGNDCNGQTVFDSGKEIAARADDNAENHQNNRRTEHFILCAADSPGLRLMAMRAFVFERLDINLLFRGLLVGFFYFVYKVPVSHFI